MFTIFIKTYHIKLNSTIHVLHFPVEFHSFHVKLYIQSVTVSYFLLILMLHFPIFFIAATDGAIRAVRHRLEFSGC